MDPLNISIYMLFISNLISVVWRRAWNLSSCAVLFLLGDGELPDGCVKPPEDLAELIEDTIFQKFKSTNPKYKNQIRSRVFNLRDKKNPELRENVLCGTITEEK